MINSIFKIWIWIWCFPQMFLGLIYYLILKNKIIKTIKYKNLNIYIFKSKIKFGASFGPWIFIEKSFYNQNTIKHEYGHTKLNYILGPFSLFIQDIPSAIIGLLSKYNLNIKKNYYNYFPENLADKLGNVKR